MRFVKTIGTLALISLLSACSWWGGGDKDDAADIPEQKLYQDAMKQMEAENYLDAAEKLEQLEARYPFGRYSEQTQLELIYVYTRTSAPEKALAAADRFIRLHPNHENIDYAYYMKGLTSFTKDQSLLTQYLPLDASRRDPGAALESFESFSTLVNRYPESQYAPDAQKRMQYLKNRLAAHEINVAHFYIKRGAWVAAANRGRYVVENYQETPAVPDALAVMYEAYTKLGMTDLAANANKVLKLNFPDYKYQKVEEKNPSLLSTVTFGLMGDDDVPEAPNTHLYAPSASGKPSTDKPEDAKEERSLLDRITFGVFD